MPLKSSATRGRLGQLPDPGEFVLNPVPDPPATILNRVNPLGQGPEGDEFVRDDSAGHVLPPQRIWETQRQRTWRCPETGCPVGLFVEQLPGLVAPRGSLTCRTVTWAIAQLRYEHATIEGLARQLGTTWKTLWRAVRPRMHQLADDNERLVGVSTLGVDEHVWHHTPGRASKGPTMLTGMVDLTRDQDGNVHARLLDLVPGRSGTVFAAWLKDRTATFRAGVQVATLDPFRATPTRCVTSWARPRPCWTRSTSSSSPGRPLTRFAAGSSRTPWATGAMPATRSTGSATSCAPASTT